jgi:hypothetical protein
MMTEVIYMGDFYHGLRFLFLNEILSKSSLDMRLLEIIFICQICWVGTIRKIFSFI